MMPGTAASAAYSALGQTLLTRMLEPLWDADGALAETFKSLAAGMTHDAAEWARLQQDYCAQHQALCANLARRAAGESTVPLVEPDSADRRFRAPEWREPYFDFLVQSYLLRARWLEALVARAHLDPHTHRKLRFFVRQWIDAACPANFPWSNPEALKLAFATGNENFVHGLANWAADLDKGMVSTTDPRAFEIGHNLAVTPGAVVFENDFFQLIQYRPATGEVYERPLLIVPPCINKYYVLDLRPENSFVRFVVERGHTVFMMSWRNMPPSMGRASWDDYLEHGVRTAIRICTEIRNSGDINALGFCVGGTLLASALAVERAQGRTPAASLTLLASMLDFSETGDLSVFVDEAYVRRRERDFAQGGVLQGRELALTFASLRANDLVWRYVVNNYLKGRKPEPLDFLHWNADSTNLPGAMYVYYVRNMYLENNLRVAGRLNMCGIPVDLGRVDMPAYVLATREDHIVPWQTAYASAHLLGGKRVFILGASGHVAGVVNPAGPNRRNYWINAGALPEDSEAWLANATSRAGSWWSHWADWIARYGGRKITAPARPGGGRYPELEPAPGRYVKETVN
ncbi:MAG TPA: class I poly(R)-hydroxyalkanoic acid synthase [Burkholderiales bacterium]|nr:class I poly(R)-hydroxyalkanoic acid synthase [Burkholderiales bacterium]